MAAKTSVIVINDTRNVARCKTYSGSDNTEPKYRPMAAIQALQIRETTRMKPAPMTNNKDKNRSFRKLATRLENLTVWPGRAISGTCHMMFSASCSSTATEV